MVLPFIWYIYLIKIDAASFYLGATKDLKRRMYEHKLNWFGRRPEYEVLETGYSIEWRSAEHQWIERLRALGINLVNKTSGRNGVQSLSEESRAKMSTAIRGKVVSAETRAKMSAAQKGKPKQWSEEGAAGRAATQFKPGHKAWDSLSEEAKQVVRQRSKDTWKNISPEERSRRASERAIREWQNRTPQELADVGAKISAGIRRAGPAALSERLKAARAVRTRKQERVRQDKK